LDIFKDFVPKNLLGLTLIYDKRYNLRHNLRQIELREPNAHFFLKNSEIFHQHRLYFELWVLSSAAKITLKFEHP